MAQTSAVFDPLSLCLPVNIKGRLLLRDLWKQKFGWDDAISEDLCTKWKVLYQELVLLNSSEFLIQVFRDYGPATSTFFCDASKAAYGFAVYVVQCSRSTLLFSKAKVAPTVAKSLPTLELLSVYLAQKCLKNVCGVFCRLDIKNLYVAVDAQIVLAGLLSTKANRKNIFVTNRLKDIGLLKKERNSKLNVSMKFKYVLTDQNPVDLITRRLTLNKTKLNLIFWDSSATWLRDSLVSWPVSELKCLSATDKNVVQIEVHCSAAVAKNECVVNLEKFSKLSKVWRIVTLIFRFVNRLKHSDSDLGHIAKIYLIKWAQRQHYGHKIEFLENPSGRGPPEFLQNLNLLNGHSGIVRSRGRIDKTLECPSEVKHPILLLKYYALTKLIVQECYKVYKHLGIAATLCKLKLFGYWLPRARQSIKHYIADCFVCRKYNALSFRYP